MRHYLTYQHNVQRSFHQQPDKYDGVVIPLSIAIAFPSGTYGFIRALCSRHDDIQYAIDPRNALFQKQWDRSNLRPPHEKMAAVMGEPYVTGGVVRPLQPADFDDEAVLEATVSKCLDFQMSFRMRSEDERKMLKYKKLLGVETLAPLKSPQHLIPPYYQFSERGDSWYEINLRSIEAANQHNDGIPVRPVLHCANWGDVGDWDVCISDVIGRGAQEAWFYPNFFKEHDAPAEELAAYKRAVQLASSEQLAPYMLFGGYFSMLMGYFGLEGFANGVGYGEWRDSGYHKGGTAISRIYLLKLHRYVDPPTAQALIACDPDYFGKDTEIIAGYVESDLSVVGMSKQEALEHFLECRREEFAFLASSSLIEAAAELDETLAKLEAAGPLEFEKFGPSLRRWRECLGPSEM